ncbi:MAG: PAS domain S-box protein [Agriterribacter sp.]
MELNNIEQRQAMLAAIIDSSEDAIISKDLTSRVTSWNKAAERMFGYTEAEMIGQLIHRLIPLERQGEEDEIIASMKQGKRIEHYETIRVTKSGKRLNISLTVSPIKDSKGNIIGASKIARDITRQKQNEEQLRLINEMGKAISSQLDVDYVLQIVTDTTTRLSGAAFGAFFYNKVDAKGETYMLYALSGAPREAFDKFGMPRNTGVFNPTFEGTAIVRSDDITKDPRYGKNSPHKGMPKGHLPVVSYLAIPVISQHGVVIGGLFFGHPEAAMFTEEHEHLIAAIASHAAIALDNAKLYQEINILNGKKDQFISFASHELKTPLTTIKGYLQIAEMTHMSATDFLPKINKQVSRLEGIIADLLDISKIQAGKLDFRFEKTNLLELIRESIEAVYVQSHVIELETPAEDVQVVVDKQKLIQVMVNLISNAIKYSAEGTPVKISVLLFGGEVQVTVTDKGIGMSPENIGQIFNQFYRIAPADHRSKGMGLGLFIAKEIIEAHLGRIWVESELNKGSSFHVSFPIEKRSI